MRLSSWCAVSSAMVAVVILFSLVSSTSGKAVSTIREKSHSPPHVITRRNAWWTKKSTDDANRIPHGNDWNEPTEMEDWQDIMGAKLQGLQTNTNRHGTDAIREAVGCYTRECVPEFVLCGRGTRSQAGFSGCKFEHRSCAAECFEGTGLEGAV